MGTILPLDMERAITMHMIEHPQCARCGTDAKWKNSTECAGHGDYRESWWIECPECGIATKRCGGSEVDARAEAIRVWMGF